MPSTVYPLPRLIFQPLESVIELRPTALLAVPQSWEQIKSALNLPIVVQAHPRRYDREYVSDLAERLPSLVRVIYAVGDGMILDVARYVAYRRSLPLVIVPTMIASDEAFVPAATLRDNGQDTEEITGAASDVIFDPAHVRNAPPELRTAGILDVLSIITATTDWAYANSKGRLPSAMAYDSSAVELAAGLARQAMKLAPRLADPDEAVLRQLVDLVMLTVQLNNQLGHRRATEGIEHIFAAALPDDPDSPLSHAEKVAAGLLFAAALHGRDTKMLRNAIQSAGVKVGVDGAIPTDQLRRVALTLPSYTSLRNLPYTLLNELESEGEVLQKALDNSTLFAEAPSFQPAP